MTKMVWDHTVHYVNDLEQAKQTFVDQGITAFDGGSHKQWGTYNVLSYFDLNYLEFLAIEDRALAESLKPELSNEVVKDAVHLLPKYEGLSRVALRTDDIETVRQRLIDHQIDVSPLISGKRYDASGQLIEWKMMTIAGNFDGLRYPFVIQWAGSDEARREQLTQNGMITEHPMGPLSVQAALYRVPNPKETVDHWAEIFAIEKKTSTILVLGDKEFRFEQGPEAKLYEIIFTGQHEKLIELSGGRYRVLST
ncbi:VOC family protein [Amphibacillus sp. Q70]|uniref:VOC family protein n=1 Tax=Amphibacillus sp. Q70 TaxID=3453416 RepID=UPI003F8502E5